MKKFNFSTSSLKASLVINHGEAKNLYSLISIKTNKIPRLFWYFLGIYQYKELSSK